MNKLLNMLITLLLLSAAINSSACNIDKKMTDCTGSEVSVFGHCSPNTDAVSSAIIYAWELQNPTPTSINKEAICAKPYVNSDTPNKERLFVLKYFGIDIPTIIDQITNDTIFATVDTNNIDKYPDWASEFVSTHLHSVVDHHKLTGTTPTNKPIVIDIHNMGSAGSIL